MKTKNLLFSLLLVGAVGVTGTYAQKPKLAVLVVGMGSAAKSDDFATRLGSDLNRDGEYELQTKDNNPDVALKLTALRAAHTASTPVDTTGLAAWGKCKGRDFVQLVVERTTAGTAVVTVQVERVAQLVDCSTGKFSERGTYRMNLIPRGMETSGLQLAPVTGGVFEMGCNSSRDGGSCGLDQTPLHYVKVNNFRIGKYPITQAQWREVMGSLPSELTNAAYLGDNKPVIYVSHDDIVAEDTGFLAKLNALTGRNYRLPTEAEWEYAARGCNSGQCESFPYSGSKTVGDVAYYNQSSGGPATVGSPRSPNRLGIYDMSGNVYEWCSDWYGFYPSATEDSPQDNPTGSTYGSYRVVHGGSWVNKDESYCRIAYRGRSMPSDRLDFYGFRVVLP
jgi:formylglycine-generating enzyme required for sulfatase activity